jgi:hypothetical protein
MRRNQVRCSDVVYWRYLERKCANAPVNIFSATVSTARFFGGTENNCKLNVSLDIIDPCLQFRHLNFSAILITGMANRCSGMEM